MKNQMSVIAMAMVMCLTMASCGASKSTAVSVTDQKQMPQQTGYVSEVEITFPCGDVADSNEEFIRVQGQGTSKDRTMAKKRAYQSALAGLSSKLDALVSTGDNLVGVSANSESEDFHDKMVAVTKNISQARVAGYRTACEKYTMNTVTGAYNCYVVIEFGKQEIVREMYDNMIDQGLLKADFDYERYLEAFDKDLKEYEATHK